MPEKNKYIIMTIVGGILGLLWGAVNLINLIPLLKAIENGDSEIAWRKANAIKYVTFAAVAWNVIWLIGYGNNWF